MLKEKGNIKSSVSEYLNNCYFNVQGTSANGVPFLDEAHLAKLVTKIVVSAATVFTTSLSLRQYIKDISSSHKSRKLL